MKITKIRTQMGELQTPVSTELDLVVERMRSEETKTKADNIARSAMASRLAQVFPRWFLAMVAQALDKNRDHGNSMVPMLIGGQGIMKSTFCKNILPPSMREYYMDLMKKRV